MITPQPIVHLDNVGQCEDRSITVPEGFTTRVKVVDFSKARRGSKHDPQIGIQEGVKRYVAWIKRAQPRVWDTKKRLLASIDHARELLCTNRKCPLKKDSKTRYNGSRTTGTPSGPAPISLPGMSSATRYIGQEEIKAKELVHV